MVFKYVKLKSYKRAIKSKNMSLRAYDPLKIPPNTENSLIQVINYLVNSHASKSLKLRKIFNGPLAATPPDHFFLKKLDDGRVQKRQKKLCQNKKTAEFYLT